MLSGVIFLFSGTDGIRPVSINYPLFPDRKFSGSDIQSISLPNWTECGELDTRTDAELWSDEKLISRFCLCIYQINFLADKGMQLLRDAPPELSPGSRVALISALVFHVKSLTLDGLVTALGDSKFKATDTEDLIGKVKDALISRIRLLAERNSLDASGQFVRIFKLLAEQELDVLAEYPDVRKALLEECVFLKLESGTLSLPLGVWALILTNTRFSTPVHNTKIFKAIANRLDSIQRAYYMKNYRQLIDGACKNAHSDVCYLKPLALWRKQLNQEVREEFDKVVAGGDEFWNTFISSASLFYVTTLTYSGISAGANERELASTNAK